MTQSRFNLSTVAVDLQGLTLQSQLISQEAFALEQAVATASLEALQINRPHKALFQKLVNLVHDTTSLINDKIAALFPKKEHLDIKGLSDVTRETTYTNLMHLQVPVPPGMSVPWVEYLAVLQEATNIANRLYEEVLYPFELFIGQALNNPEIVSNASFQHSVRPHNLDDIKRKLSRVRANGEQASIPYSKAVRRNGDWAEIQRDVDTLLKSQLQLPVELVKNTVDSIDISMTKLMEAMSDTNRQYRPAPEVISQLAELCTLIAEEVTFYSATISLNAAAVIALEQTQEALKNVKAA
jgi:hypothetical protein